MNSTAPSFISRLWSSVEFKLILAWMAVVVATTVLDPGHTYWNNPGSSAELIIRNTVLLGFCVGQRGDHYFRGHRLVERFCDRDEPPRSSAVS